MANGQESTAAAKGKMEILDKLQGGNFLAIESVMPAVNRRRLELSTSKVGVFRAGKSAYVVFVDEKTKGPDGRTGYVAGTDQLLKPEEIVMLTDPAAKVKLSDRIDAGNIKAFEAAVEEFRKKRTPDLNQYTMELIRDSGEFAVIFSAADATPGVRGSSGSVAGFEVELGPDFKATRSHFVR